MKELRPGGDHRAFFVCNEIATEAQKGSLHRLPFLIAPDPADTG
jgi:hypothetical protein